MTDIYDRQTSIINQAEVGNHAIIGCGGVGAWTAIYLAMSGAKRLYLFDSDVLELSNLNRLPYPSSYLGLKKTTALSKFIKNIRPNVWIEELGHLDSMTIPILEKCTGVTCVFCCTDNYNSQVLTRKVCKAKRNRFRFIRVGYDGISITLVDELPAWESGNAEPEDGYRITPSWVVPASTVAALAVCKALYYPAYGMTASGNLHKLISKTEIQ